MIDLLREIFVYIQDVKDSARFLIAFKNFDLCKNLRQYWAQNIKDHDHNISLSYETLHVRDRCGRISTYSKNNRKIHEVVASTAGPLFRDQHGILNKWTYENQFYHKVCYFRYPVTKIALGHNFVTILSGKKIYGKGSNYWGQLTPNLEHLHTFTPIKYGEAIVDVCCGTDNSIVKTISGRAISRGRDLNCEITNINDISAGETHVVCREKDSFLLFFSRPIHIAQLSKRDIQPLFSRTRVYMLSVPPNTEKVICGGDFTIAKTLSGIIYGIGRGFQQNQWTFIAKDVKLVICSRYQIAFQSVQDDIYYLEIQEDSFQIQITLRENKNQEKKNGKTADTIV